MQGFWNLIGKAGEGPGKDFQYDIGEKTSSSYDSKSIWTLHHGKKRANCDMVSVFVCDAKVSSPDDFQLAKTGHKRLKTLRHPNVIKYLDGFESESLVYMVTEPVVPLVSYLDEEDGRNPNLITWGVYQVVNGLSFLVNNGKLIHENVNIFSIFVGLDGEWKLGGVEYVHTPDTSPAGKLPCLCRYDPPEGNNSNKKEIWSTDAWGLGCLIWEVYNGALQKATDLKSVSKIPKSLMLHYCDLVHANPKKRTNPKDFLDRCLQAGQFFDNDFVKANLFLSEIQIKDASQQKEFFVSLDKSLDTFPKQFCVHKVLPQLLNAFEFGAVGTAVLSPLFKVGLLLDDAAYQAKIVPCIIKLFSSNDRATRIQLLQQMEKFVKHLQPAVVDNQIFGCVATGFGDTLPAMREQTLKAMLLLAPKLSPKTISNQVLRFFAKLQMDEQPGIRTNTTICLGKIAEYIPEETRQKVLAPGFIRAIRDPFPHARNAGIMAMAATQKYYTSQEIATRLLPALCACAVDQEKSVRDSAFKVIKSYVSVLETYSEDPENAVNAVANKQEEQGSTWTGWAVSSFTSRFYQGQNPATASGNATKSSTDENGSSPAPTESGNPPSNASSNLTAPKEEEVLSDNSNYDDAYGDDYWDEKKKSDKYAKKNSDSGFKEVKKELVEIQDTFKKIPAKNNSMNMSSSDQKSDHDSDSDYGDWGGDGDGWGGGNDEWGSFDAPKKKQATKKKKKSDNEWGDGSWNSFDTDSSSKPSKNSPKASKAKTEPEPVVDKFAVQPFSDGPKNASSLFESTSTPASDFDSFAPIETKGGSSNDDGFTSTTCTTAADQGWSNTSDDWGGNDWGGGDEDDEKKKEEDAKEKRKQEMLRKREEKRQQRELAAKERKNNKPSGGGAMKLGAVKKAPKGDG